MYKSKLNGMSWRNFELSEVCTKIGSGATPRGGEAAYTTVGTSLIRSQNVLDFTFSEDGLAFINDEQAKGLANVVIEERDVLINITGDSVARVCQVPSNVLPARVNQHVAILRADPSKLCPEYLKYALLAKTNKEKLLSLASTGATRKALTKGMLEDFEILVPEDLPTQVRIAEILSTLDDKMELNRRMNQTLEQMAQTLFRQYFVKRIDEDNLPEEWKIEKIGSCCNVFRGASPRPITDPKYFSNGTIPWIKIADATAESSIYINSTKEYCTELAVTKSRFLKKGSLVLSNSATVGIPKILNLNGCIHDGWLSFKEFQKITRNFLFFVLVHKLKEFNQIATGSVQNNLNTSLLKEASFILPPADLIEEFDKQCELLFQKILCNEVETAQLKKIRDTLLPKLMSGEIDVMQAPLQHEPVLS